MVTFPLSWISIITLCLIIAALILAYVKKIMMTYALVVINFIVFIISLIFQRQIITELGFVPAYFSLESLPRLYTLFTSMFVHGGVLHVLMNMLIFFFLGISFEDRIGRNKFIFIYIITGICGALAYSIINPGSTTVLVGASGAIFGILGAYAFSYPRDKVVMPIPLPIMIFTRMRVITAAIMFASIETAYFLLIVEDNIAHVAHLGGLIGGVMLAAVLIRTKPSMSSQRHRITLGSESQSTGFGFRKSNTLENLSELAVTDEQKRMVDRIRNENVPEVRKAWIDHFLDTAQCPQCGSKLRHNQAGKIWCNTCDFTTHY